MLQMINSEVHYEIGQVPAIPPNVLKHLTQSFAIYRKINRDTEITE